MSVGRRCTHSAACDLPGTTGTGWYIAEYHTAAPQSPLSPRAWSWTLEANRRPVDASRLRLLVHSEANSDVSSLDVSCDLSVSGQHARPGDFSCPRA